VKESLDVIPGSVPNLINLPPGCQFAPRCRSRVQYGLTICPEIEPDLLPVTDDHTVRCWLYQDYEPKGFKAPLAKG
jgi:oligopeptide/dipeptide ABC transporter ATP-binding protein